MRVGVYLPAGTPESFRVYVENVRRGLTARGVTVCGFADTLPEDVDLYWDPRSGGGNPPLAALLAAPRPWVVTVHGVAPMALPPREYFDRLVDRLRAPFWGREKVRAWRPFRGRYAAIIAVSEYGKESIVRCLGLPAEGIRVCPHGVDHALFRPGPSKSGRRPYFLHVSNDERRKNVDRIVAAWRRIAAREVPLLLKLPRGTRRVSGDGVEVVSERLSDAAIADLYRGALAYVFPSLYEGFGLPIVEAMACGTPVITADGNACAEVAGDAALTVDPRSVGAITAAMVRLLDEPALAAELRRRGLAHAAAFTWEESAACHHAAFAAALCTAPAAA